MSEATRYCDNIVCPHCGHENKDSWEVNEGEHNCHRCDKPMLVERHVSVRYSTKCCTSTTAE